LTRKRRGLVDPLEVKFTVRKVFEGLRRVLMFFTQNLLLNSERLFEERLGFRVLAHRRFVVPVRTIHAGPNPKYFGPERGVTYYNLVSDRFVDRLEPPESPVLPVSGGRKASKRLRRVLFPARLLVFPAQYEVRIICEIFVVIGESGR
jgi:hypothetical protein